MHRRRSSQRRPIRRRFCIEGLFFTVLGLALAYGTALGQADKKSGEDKPSLPRGSIVEDRAARRLMEAGDLRIEAGETDKGLELWRSVIERYPRSKVRFDAHMKLGEHHLAVLADHAKAKIHFEAVYSEENRNEDQRALALLKTGVCQFQARQYAQCFKVFRQVINDYPVSQHVNRAYYYIGLGHFKQGHYGRAIESLEKVGTVMSTNHLDQAKLEIGKRLFIKVEDADLAVLAKDETVEATCKTTAGDQEKVHCLPLGRNVRVVLGSVPTRLGKPQPNNGVLEVSGRDEINVEYSDEHTADGKLNQSRLRKLSVAANGVVRVMDGAFVDPIEGVVVGKQVNVEAVDADRDQTDDADWVEVQVKLYRKKTAEEIEEEKNALAAEKALKTESSELVIAEDAPDKPLTKEEQFQLQHRLIDQSKLLLTETVVEESSMELEETDAEPVEVPAEQASIDDLSPGDLTEDQPGQSEFVELVETEAEDTSIHTGLFQGALPVRQSEQVIEGDSLLQALPGDVVRIEYVDQVNITAGPRQLTASAICIEGSLGDVRVAKAQISDEDLRLRTQLKTAKALTQIGNHYKEFGLEDPARIKFQEALEVAEEATSRASEIKSLVLEQCYVQLWEIYFALDNLRLAVAMSQKLMREFPESTFIDDAMLKQAEIARKQAAFKDAIALYGSLLKLKASDLRDEAQFGIAECYERMAEATTGSRAQSYYEKAFENYQKVYEQFPDSGRVGDAVARAANYFYQRQDYQRAIDVFEGVIANHPDANYLDVIYFNYGRCLYRTERKKVARQQFDLLVLEFPESKLATEAKRISDALVKAGF